MGGSELRLFVDSSLRPRDVVEIDAIYDHPWAVVRTEKAMLDYIEDNFPTTISIQGNPDVLGGLPILELILRVYDKHYKPIPYVTCHDSDLSRRGTILMRYYREQQKWLTSIYDNFERKSLL